jgi:hypothetical protein
LVISHLFTHLPIKYYSPLISTLVHNKLFLGDFDDLSGVFERVESGSKTSTSSKDESKDKKASSVSDFSSIFDDDKFLSSTNELSGIH